MHVTVLHFTPCLFEALTHHVLSRGAWLFELTIKEDTPQLNVDERFNLVQGHVRVGWARSQAKLQVLLYFTVVYSTMVC